MDMKKTFVGLGIGVLVVTGLIQSGAIDVNQVFTTGDSAQGIDLAGKTLDEKWNGGSTKNQSTSQSSSSTDQTVTQQPTYNESEWVKVREKTCEVAWNNEDFTNGWCPLGKLPPGEYRFKVRSSLKDVHTNGESWSYPAEGLSIKRWRDSSASMFSNLFEQWGQVKNGMVGMVIFKMDNEYPLSTWEISINQPEVAYASINFPPTEDNWKSMGFKGKITIEILKKKT